MREKLTEKSTESLDENLLQSTQDLRLGQRVTFQQDNDAKHTAKTMQESLNVLEWLSQSLAFKPDLTFLERPEHCCATSLPI